MIASATLSAGCQSNEILDNRIKSLESEVSAMKYRLELNEQSLGQNQHPHFATLQASEKAYQSVYTKDNNFAFLVALEDIQPYANGYKVKIDLGNPSLVTFIGVDMEVTWGPTQPVYSKDTPDYSQKMKEWASKQQTTRKSVEEALQPGSWNTVDIILAPASANDIGSIEVSDISTKSVNLRR